MDLFRGERVETELNADVSYACALNDRLYFGTSDGRVLKWRIGREASGDPNGDPHGEPYGHPNGHPYELPYGLPNGEPHGDLRGRTPPKVRAHMEETHTVKKNQKVEKIILVEKEGLMIIQINDGIYFAKDFHLQNLTLLCKDANLCALNEKSKSDLVVYSMKKKKILFFQMESGKYKVAKELAFNEFISSFLWVSDSLFLTVQKSYYLLRLKKNEQKILLYSHEYEQSYKHITLINVNEIFIVCDLNIGVFYDVETSMPSRKNTITLVDNVRHLLSFRFFLCSLNSKGVINFYNVNNQQHVQTLCMEEYVHHVVSYSDVGSSLLCPMLLLEQEGHDGYDSYDAYEGYNAYAGEAILEGGSSPGEAPGDRARYELDLDATLASAHGAYPHQQNQQHQQYRQHRQYRARPLRDSSPPGDDPPADAPQLTSQSGDPNAANNYIYFFSQSSIQVVRCQELFEYLPKCILQNKIDRGFLLIDNYIFESNVERVATLNTYSKACAYYLFSRAQFALSFVHFERADVHLPLLLSFWERYLSSGGGAENAENAEGAEGAENTEGGNHMGDTPPQREPHEVISKPFSACLPPLCSVEELIDRHLSAEGSNAQGSSTHGGDDSADLIMGDTPAQQEEEKKKKKKKLLKIANNCLIKYLVKKRNEFVLQEGGMMGMYEEEPSAAEVDAQPEGTNSEMQSNGETTHIGSRNNLLSCVDNLLIKLMVINEWPGFSHFLMNTPNLRLQMSECIRFLKKHSKFVETALMYIRLKRFEEAIQMCSTFLSVYNGWLRGEEVQPTDDPSGSDAHTAQPDQPWRHFFLKQKFSKNVEKGTGLHSLFNEMYNILLVLNDSLHMMDINKSQIKKLFENAFPFLIKFNESAFFNMIISRHFLLKPEEILHMFQTMERDKVHIKGKEYMQKYILHFLKHEKMNKEVNTSLVEFYLNNVEMPEQVRQKKILRFLRSSYPLDVARLARMVPRGRFPLVQALLFGRMDRHYDSLVILTQQSLRVSEKYCLYHSLLFKGAAKRMSKEDHRKLFAGLFHNDKEVCRGLYGQLRKRTEEHEGPDDSYVNIKNRRSTPASRFNRTSKKRLNLSDALVSEMMRNYHKRVYVGMEKGLLAKLDSQRGRRKNGSSELGGQNGQETSKEKNEYHFMLSLMEQEGEDSSGDELTEVYCDGGEANFVRDVEGSPNLSTHSGSDFSTGSDGSTASRGSTPSSESTSSHGSTPSSVDDDVVRAKRKGKNRAIGPNRRPPPQKKKGGVTNKKSYAKREEETKKNKEPPLGSSKHRNVDVDVLENFDVYRSGKNRSCGFFFLLVKVCLDKHNDPNVDEREKQTYRNYVTYVLNKYGHHGDFENPYILEMIPKEWSLEEVLHFVSLNLKKRNSLYMCMHFYHNLVKANYLSASYELIGGKEQRLLVKDKLTCQVCKGPIAEKRFAYFSPKVVTHMLCLEKYDEELHR
ncbi:vacuolar protein sorting-associated protein 3, putative [Plasmodium vivax]|uniref:Vacuolar protein sorting-associated protein 3, putative n=2 Tax=Plasmodium vivax TaxID=5855 RepID=A0A1G4HIV8_PLAVI|nr:vacuolar protein sorting-associated protein 3, putative [Plasmodium vivax]